MERLTHKARYEAGYKPNKGAKDWQVADRLGAYENTGLTPEQIMGLKERMNDGWIPVEERLPEAGQRVIATIKHHAWISDYDQNWVPESEKTMHQEYTESCEAVMTGNGIWSYRCKEDDYDMDTASVHPGKSLAYPIAEVIAWRPLPEPYRPKKESEGSRRLREREEFFKE